MSTSPRTIGRYELRERLGEREGTQAWKAFDPPGQRYVVIKVLHGNLQSDSDFPTRFIQQAQRIAALHHPNIIRIHDFQVVRSPEPAKTMGYIVMDYVEGQTLADAIRQIAQQRVFPATTELIRLLIPISLGLDYAHQHGVLHGDLKPSNVLLDKRNTTFNPMGQPILSDFGMAQMLRTPNQAPNSLGLAEVAYISPEQAQGQVGTERSDLYALGVIVYELFTGVLPFRGENVAGILTQHIHATPTFPANINQNISSELGRVVLRGLAKDPAVRFPSATALVAALAGAVNMPVPEQVLRQTGQSVDSADMATYLSPLPPSRALGMTPSSPGLPAAGFSPLPPAVGSTPIPPGVSWSGVSGTGGSLTYPLPLSSTGNIPAVTVPGPPPTQAVVQSPPVFAVQPSPPPTKHRRRGLYIVLTVLLILVVLGSGLTFTYFTFFSPSSAPANTVVGHAFFVSSGLVTQNSAQGITDQLQISLQNIPNPQPGKSYYAWLLNDKSADQFPILLGKLQVNQGVVKLPFAGTVQHIDLLATYSRFLITEEAASVAPTNPSLDPNDWSYYAAFSTVPNTAGPLPHYSVLDHLRHLLAEDPKLKAVGLPGGLDIWLFRNTEKILEWSGSAKDTWKSQTVGGAEFMRRQIVRILDYLDGAAHVQAEVPTGTHLLVDATIAKVALIDQPNDVPPDYLHHIGKHLREITESPNVTPEQVALAIEINQAVNNVQSWLEQVHTDALQLVTMSDAQLLGSGALSTLDDMATQANNAFTGKIDPASNQVMEGVAQIHYNIQRLAIFDIASCRPNGTNICAL